MDESEKKTNGLSRRDFLLGSTLVGAGFAGGALVGCAPTTSGGAGGAASGEASVAGNGPATNEHQIFTIDTPTLDDGVWSWSTPPAAIEDGKITNTVECDVLVIGSGLAGCCAALSAMEKGANTIVIDKNEEGVVSARGLDIGVFGTKVQKELIEQGLMEEPDYAHIVRRWSMWAQSRVRESLLWQYARKSGAAFDWLYDQVVDYGLKAFVWNGYYKGPDYTEYPVAHIFCKEEHFQEAAEYPRYGGYGETFACGVLVPVLYDLIAKGGGEIRYSQKCVRLLRDGETGPCTGVVAGEEGAYTRYTAKSVIIASGDYASNPEMVQCYAPSVNFASDLIFYLPEGVNQGEIHQQAMWIGAAMQASAPHAAVVHLDFGAASFGFLHVNAAGKRYMNEDVNTQSKSITKAFQPGKISFTVYDANGLVAAKEQVDNGVGGGLQWGLLAQPIGQETSLEGLQQQLENELDSGLVVQADTLEELAGLMNVDSATFLATVERYNQMCEQGHDDDFGKRAEILTPILEPPFYAGKLLAGCLTMCGGLRCDADCRVLDVEDNPIGGLYICGSAQGDFFGAGDYPTLVPGIGLGRCVTFGRIAGINAAGGNADEEIKNLESLGLIDPERLATDGNIYLQGDSSSQGVKGL
jgi:succinate dehydrogenase/fumarate reductase flavoprotein subunit